MEFSSSLTWSWLGILTKKRLDALRQVYGSLDDALSHIDEQMLKGLGCREDTILRTLNRLEEFDPDAYAGELKKRGITLINIDDPGYPETLRQIPDPPVFLHYRGDLSILAQPCIGLVGTREMSAYGERVTEAFVPPLVRSGMVTVSGLAQGIDATVARETIRAGGKTVAALGHGLSMILPKSNAKLGEEIIDHGGLLLSEFPLDQGPDKYTFPARNRIIAALSLGTVVLEAGEGSGALITAELALEYGREVFAVPGQIFDPHYDGCHQLIARGHAKLVMKPEDVLQEFRITPAEKSNIKEPIFKPSSAEEEALWSVLTTLPQPVDDLVEKSGLTAGVINATLTILELQGVVKNAGGWVRN